MRKKLSNWSFDMALRGVAGLVGAAMVFGLTVMFWVTLLEGWVGLELLWKSL